MELILKYQKVASAWDRSIDKLGYPRAYQDFLTGLTLKTGKVIDAGAGTGAFAAAWIAVGGSPDITLIDNSDKMLRQARGNLSSTASQAHFKRLRIEEFKPDEVADAVLAAHVIEHFINPEIALDCFSAWLKPGGLAFLIVSRPHWCNLLIWFRYRHRWYDPSTVITMAASAGLSHRLTYLFRSGPPSRTSYGYVFQKNDERTKPC